MLLQQPVYHYTVITKSELDEFRTYHKVVAQKCVLHSKFVFGVNVIVIMPL